MSPSSSSQDNITAKLAATICWLQVIAWMWVIFLFSGQPHSAEFTAGFFGPYNFLVRKVAHMTEYAVLFILVRRAILASGTKSKSPDSAPATIFAGGKLRKWFDAASVISLSISVLYACGDEWHQSFIPGRTSTANDVFIDAAGTLIAWLSGLFQNKWRNNDNAGYE